MYPPDRKPSTTRQTVRRPPVQPVRIAPGCFMVTADETELMTVLGSCVAVCLSDTQSKVAGMNHFLLPEPFLSSNALEGNAARYGVHAMELLINSLMRAGGRRNQLVAHVFGGAAVLRHLTDIGAGNIRFARHFLANEGIPIISESVGGSEARKVSLLGSSGNCRVEFLTALKRLNSEEKRVHELLGKGNLTGRLNQPVELFDQYKTRETN